MIANARPQKPDWDALDRASARAEREDYARSTPGQRVEQQIALSRELTKLASRRLRRK